MGVYVRARVCPGGGYVQGISTPEQGTMGNGRQTDGSHPTRMLSCFKYGLIFADRQYCSCSLVMQLATQSTDMNIVNKNTKLFSCVNQV